MPGSDGEQRVRGLFPRLPEGRGCLGLPAALLPSRISTAGAAGPACQIPELVRVTLHPTIPPGTRSPCFRVHAQSSSSALSCFCPASPGALTLGQKPWPCPCAPVPGTSQVKSLYHKPYRLPADGLSLSSSNQNPRTPSSPPRRHAQSVSAQY